MTVTFTLLPEDLLACHADMCSRTKPGPSKRARTVQILGWVFYIPLALIAVFTPTSDALKLTAIACVVALSFFGHRSIRETLAEEHTTSHYTQRGNEVFLGARTLTTSPEGFVIGGAMSESRYPWSSVFEVSRTSQYIFIYIAPIAAHTVPLRDLTPELQTEFWGLLQGSVSADRFRRTGA